MELAKRLANYLTPEFISKAYPPRHPDVKQHNMRHVDTASDVLQFFNGFFDGSVYGKSDNLT